MFKGFFVVVCLLRDLTLFNSRLPEAIATRDAMAKCLYGALFDWIVMQVNHALLSKKDTLREHQGHSIGKYELFNDYLVLLEIIIYYSFFDCILTCLVFRDLQSEDISSIHTIHT